MLHVFFAGQAVEQVRMVRPVSAVEGSLLYDVISPSDLPLLSRFCDDISFSFAGVTIDSFEHTAIQIIRDAVRVKKYFFYCLVASCVLVSLCLRADPSLGFGLCVASSVLVLLCAFVIRADRQYGEAIEREWQVAKVVTGSRMALHTIAVTLLSALRQAVVDSEENGGILLVPLIEVEYSVLAQEVVELTEVLMDALSANDSDLLNRLICDLNSVIICIERQVTPPVLGAAIRELCTIIGDARARVPRLRLLSAAAA